MHPILQNVESQFHKILGPLDAEETQQHPGGNLLRWSPQQVVEHLILTYQLSSKELAIRLEKRRPTKARCTPLEWWLQLIVLSLGRMPKGAPAPPDTVPAPSLPLSGHELAWKLASEAEKMDDLLTQCRAQFGLERVANHMILGPLRVDQWRRFHVIHGLHHLQQIQQILHTVPASRFTRPAMIRRPSWSSKEAEVPVNRTPA